MPRAYLGAGFIDPFMIRTIRTRSKVSHSTPRPPIPPPARPPIPPFILSSETPAKYVRPSDSQVGQEAPWTADGGGNDDDEATATAARVPFLRVFTGCHSEGQATVKWREAAAPLAGLLVRVPV